MSKWSKEEIELLKEIYPSSEEEELEKIFNRKYKTISEYARKLNVYRNYREINSRWTKENIEFLIANFANADYGYLEDKFKTNIKNIMAKAYSLGLKRDDFWWTLERIKILKEMYLNDAPIEDICKAVGNSSPFAVYAYANTHGILRENRYWTEEKLNIMKEDYYDKDWKYLIEKLGKTQKQINGQASKMGLERRKKLTVDEDEYIKNNYGKLPIKEIAENINRSVVSIKSRASKLGLRVLTDWENYGTENLLDLLKNLAIQLQRTPVGDELTSFGLPSPITYVRYFGSYSKACELAGLETASLYGKRCYSKNGDLCLSISEAIITNYLIDNNIPYKKEEAYSKYIPNIKTKKKVDWVLRDGTFVEYFGLPEKDYYSIKIQEKINICVANEIKLIEIYDKDLKNLSEVFKNYII
jgi:hypothetical protein